MYNYTIWSLVDWCNIRPHRTAARRRISWGSVPGVVPHRSCACPDMADRGRPPFIGSHGQGRTRPLSQDQWVICSLACCGQRIGQRQPSSQLPRCRRRPHSSRRVRSQAGHARASTASTRDTPAHERDDGGTAQQVGHETLIYPLADSVFFWGSGFSCRAPARSQHT